MNLNETDIDLYECVSSSVNDIIYTIDVMYQYSFAHVHAVPSVPH